LRLLALLPLLLLLGTGAAAAQTPPRPKQVIVGDHLATIDLPSGYLFLDKKATDAFLEANGNVPEESDLAVIRGVDGGSWFIAVEWDEVGHVRDDDAGRLDAAALLADMRKANEAANVERKKRGHPVVDIRGWFEKPRYVRAAHALLWAVKVRDRSGTWVNYKARLLGRSGILSLNLVTDPGAIWRDRLHAERLVRATRFMDGERYDDYRAGQDPDAGLDLSGLIVGPRAAPSGSPGAAPPAPESGGGEWLLAAAAGLAVLGLAILRRSLARAPDD